jgi:hypothetical protein
LLTNLSATMRFAASAPCYAKAMRGEHSGAMH